MVQISKKNTKKVMIGFFFENAMKISNINLMKILVCSPGLFFLKNLMNFCLEHLLETLQNHAVGLLGVSVKEMIG